MATVVFQRQASDVVEWILELDRAKDVVEEWKQSGLAEAMAAERPSRGKMVGVSDESQEEANKAADAKYGLVGGDDTLSACGIRVGGGWSGMAVE